MKARDIAEHLKDGRIEKGEISEIEHQFSVINDEFVQTVGYQYIKYYDNIRIDILLNYLDSSRNSYSLSEVIGAMSIRGVNNSRFVEKLLQFSECIEWDDDSILRAISLTSMPNVVPMSDRVVKLLKKAYLSEDDIVRDAAIVAAQKYSGLPAGEIKWGFDEVDLSSAVSADILGLFSGI